MSLSFPTNPVINQLVTISGTDWTYVGTHWKRQTVPLKTVNGQSLSGAGDVSSPSSALTAQKVTELMAAEGLTILQRDSASRVTSYRFKGVAYVMTYNPDNTIASYTVDGVSKTLSYSVSGLLQGTV